MTSGRHIRSVMKTVNQLINDFEANVFDARLQALYLDDSRLEAEKERYIQALKMFESLYGDQEVQIFSAGNAGFPL